MRELGQYQERMSLSWVPVTLANWRQVCRLQVRPEQRQFVPPVSKTMSLVYLASEGARLDPYAIQLDQQSVGFFTCTTYPTLPESLIFGGFLIDAAYQRRGIGRSFMATFPNWAGQAYPDCREIMLNLQPGNFKAGQLYIEAGFEHLAGDHPWWPGSEVFRFALDVKGTTAMRTSA